MTRQMDASGSRDANREYYDAFSAEYERERGKNDPGGYHELLDELEAGYVRRFGQGKDVLEVGCGTGLVMLRIREFARLVRGVDLSPGMLSKAQARGFAWESGQATRVAGRCPLTSFGDGRAPGCHGLRGRGRASGGGGVARARGGASARPRRRRGRGAAPAPRPQSTPPN